MERSSSADYCAAIWSHCHSASAAAAAAEQPRIRSKTRPVDPSSEDGAARRSAGSLGTDAGAGDGVANCTSPVDSVAANGR